MRRLLFRGCFRGSYLAASRFHEVSIDSYDDLVADSDSEKSITEHPHFSDSDLLDIVVSLLPDRGVVPLVHITSGLPADVFSARHGGVAAFIIKHPNQMLLLTDSHMKKYVGRVCDFNMSRSTNELLAPFKIRRTTLALKSFKRSFVGDPVVEQRLLDYVKAPVLVTQVIAHLPQDLREDVKRVFGTVTNALRLTNGLELSPCGTQVSPAGRSSAKKTLPLDSPLVNTSFDDEPLFGWNGVSVDLEEDHDVHFEDLEAGSTGARSDQQPLDAKFLPPKFVPNESSASLPTPPKLSNAPFLASSSRAWKTPTEILSAMVEVVPSFFVNVNRITLPESIGDVVARFGTAEKFYRAYRFYFDVKVSIGGVEVRMRPNLSHPRKGVADSMYDAVGVPLPPIQPARAPSRSPESRVDGMPCVEPITAQKSDISETRAENENASTSLETRGRLLKLLLSPEFQEVGAIKLPEALWVVGVEEHSETVLKTIVGCPELFQMNDRQDQVRLRPISQAPNSVFSELASKDSGLKATMLSECPHLKRPSWCRVRAAYDSFSATTKGRIGSEENFIKILRQNGDSFWVSNDSTSVRRFTGNPEIDDLQHFIVHELHQLLPPSGERRTLSEALLTLQPQLRQLLPGDVHAAATFLRMHIKMFTIVSNEGDYLISRSSKFKSQPNLSRDVPQFKSILNKRLPAE